MKDFLQSQSINEAAFKKIKFGKVEFMATLDNNAPEIGVQLLVTKSSMLDDFRNNEDDYKSKIVEHFRSKTKLPWLLDHDNHSPGVKIYVEKYDLYDHIIKSI